MQKVKDLADKLKIVPRLKLGVKLAGGGVKSTGPHHVKFLEEPMIIMGKDHEGKPREELKFLVEENGITYRWNVPIKSKDGQPSYMIERLMNIEVGDERTLEMSRQGARNYIDVRAADEAPDEPPDEEMDEIADSIPGPNDQQ